MIVDSDFNNRFDNVILETLFEDIESFDFAANIAVVSGLNHLQLVLSHHDTVLVLIEPHYRQQVVERLAKCLEEPVQVVNETTNYINSYDFAITAYLYILLNIDSAMTATVLKNETEPTTEPTTAVFTDDFMNTVRGVLDHYNQHHNLRWAKRYCDTIVTNETEQRQQRQLREKDGRDDGKDDDENGLYVMYIDM